MRLKVMQVVECGGPGGTGSQVAAICNGLDAGRFEVSLAYAVRAGQPESYRAQANGAVAAHHIPEMVREITPLKDGPAFLKLRALFKRERPDVVHAHSSKAGFLARLAARAAGVPKIFYSPRGYGFQQQDRGIAARALFQALERGVSGIGDVIAVSPSEAELARARCGARRVHLVCDPYLGPPPSAEAPPPKQGLLVGGCGRMTFARNLEAFVILSQRLTDSRNGLRCVWIGGGEEEAAVKKKLTDMNLLAKVEVTGWLPADEARRRLRELDVFVHYSRWEGLPNAVLDAMAAGLPVVASDVPGNRDAVMDGQTGRLVTSEIDLLESTLALVDDPAARARLGAAGRARVQSEFSLPKALRQLETLYSA